MNYELRIMNYELCRLFFRLHLFFLTIAFFRSFSNNLFNPSVITSDFSGNYLLVETHFCLIFWNHFLSP